MRSLCCSTGFLILARVSKAAAVGGVLIAMRGPLNVTVVNRLSCRRCATILAYRQAKADQARRRRRDRPPVPFAPTRYRQFSQIRRCLEQSRSQERRPPLKRRSSSPSELHRRQVLRQAYGRRRSLHDRAPFRRTPWSSARTVARCHPRVPSTRDASTVDVSELWAGSPSCRQPTRTTAR